MRGLGRPAGAQHLGQAHRAVDVGEAALPEEESSVAEGAVEGVRRSVSGILAEGRDASFVGRAVLQPPRSWIIRQIRKRRDAFFMVFPPGASIIAQSEGREKRPGI